MPELPDLQVFARNLTKTLKGSKLEKVTLLHTSKVKVSKKELNEVLSGKKLREVRRVGKQLCFDFAKNAQLLMHLMLHGKLVLEARNAEPPKHVIAELRFDNNTLYLTDFQKAAHLLLNPESSRAVDALSDELTASWLTAKLERSRAKIKSILMDQKVIAGIGNAYADEILWKAKINPESIAGKIPDDVVRKLSSVIGQVLKRAEDAIVKKHPDIISGEIRDFLEIHNPNKERSPGGAEILTATVGGRKTYYTDEQKLYK
ncbi:DNA-formamidopyrimidine glycosylase family protein [Dyadobacter sp. 676]|uniref:DNA-formamidopyrimidine glycosylase family protein n=1 Tax=Dyadobacter sp. 676 TaxID=3088362 RepID=A0AAU8FI02_9BACT